MKKILLIPLFNLLFTFTLLAENNTSALPKLPLCPSEKGQHRLSIIEQKMIDFHKVKEHDGYYPCSVYLNMYKCEYCEIQIPTIKHDFCRKVEPHEHIWVLKEFSHSDVGHSYILNEVERDCPIDYFTYECILCPGVEELREQHSSLDCPSFSNNLETFQKFYVYLQNE